MSNKIIFVRHGEPEDSLDESGNYRTKPENGLTEKGKQQAEAVGRIIKGYNPRHIFSSNFPRTLETAQGINEQLDEELNLIVADALNQVHIREDFSSELLESDPKLSAKAKPFEELCTQVRNILEDLKNAKLDGNAVVVTHGILMNLLKYCAVTNESDYEKFKEQSTINSETDFAKAFIVDLNVPLEKRKIDFLDDQQEQKKRFGNIVLGRNNQMLTIKEIEELSKKHGLPVEESLLMALNINGIDYDCGYDRISGTTHLEHKDLFKYSKERGETDFFMATPVLTESPFKLSDKNKLTFDGEQIGTMSGQTEDTNNAFYYWRRGKTSLNFNPNTRLNCGGCKFCYASTNQKATKRKNLITEEDFRDFFTHFVKVNDIKSLEDLIQISLVTGCYKNSQELVKVINNIRKVANDFGFNGKIFYLGSQISNEQDLENLVSSQPLRLCFSMETFENRDVLRPNKRSIIIDHYRSLMGKAKDLGFETEFSHILGLDSLDAVKRGFSDFKDVTTSFPTVGLLQVHKGQSPNIRAEGADGLEYYLKARKIMEDTFLPTSIRPEIWENYRSPWKLKFGKEDLLGSKYPEGSTMVDDKLYNI